MGKQLAIAPDHLVSSVHGVLWELETGTFPHSFVAGVKGVKCKSVAEEGDLRLVQLGAALKD